jgi:uncharacterized membrane protein YjjP (DUF1212 family)
MRSLFLKICSRIDDEGAKFDYRMKRFAPWFVTFAVGFFAGVIVMIIRRG